MSRFLQGKITYANVVATLALVFAMSGGALAANHYLINSTKQINPKVLKKLKGATGKTGKTGAPGISIQGPTGPTGPKGDKGNPGANGAKGASAYESLPSGQSESGEYAIHTVGVTGGESVEEAATFQMSVSGGIPSEHIVYSSISSPASEHCAGPGHAGKGYLCIYSAESSNLEAPTVLNPEVSPVGTTGAGEHGFLLSWKALTTGNVTDVGTYTVTAGP
jgi:hypothetical protein